MKCTDCHREVKPVVSFDIDGTLGDYHGHFQRFAEAYLGRYIGPKEHWREVLYPYDQEFSEWLDIDKEIYRTIKLAYRQGGMKRSMPAFSGASAIVQAAHDAGAEVWLATTRPWLRLDNIDPDTRAWLERNNIVYDGLIYGEDKYDRLVEIVGKDRIACVVDDLPEQACAADMVGLTTILKVNGHNLQAIVMAQTGRSIASLVAGVQQVTEEIYRWKKEHAQ